MKNEIKKTLNYYQIFDYFLKEKNLFDFLHTNKLIKKEDIIHELKKNFKIVSGYILRQKSITKEDREKLHEQNKKEKISFFKFKLAKNVAGILKFIPSIKLIAVSGALAMKNAGESDDIDLFIVTAAHTIWVTRFFCVFLLTIIGKRRFYNAKNVKNKFCLNFFVDENHLEMKKKNLYTAHEIAQMKVLHNKDGCYEKLIQKNQWGSAYLANFFLKKRNKEKSNDSGIFAKVFIEFFKLLEPIFQVIQYAYMKPKITSEIIENGILMFHPRDYSKEILKKYKNLVLNSL